MVSIAFLELWGVDEGQQVAHALQHGRQLGVGDLNVLPKEGAPVDAEEKVALRGRRKRKPINLGWSLYALKEKKRKLNFFDATWEGETRKKKKEKNSRHMSDRQP